MSKAEKTRRRCGHTKPAPDFKPDRQISDGLSSWCRDCHAEANRAWRASVPGHARRYNAERKWQETARSCESCGREIEGTLGRATASSASTLSFESCTAVGMS